MLWNTCHSGLTCLSCAISARCLSAISTAEIERCSLLRIAMVSFMAASLRTDEGCAGLGEAPGAEREHRATHGEAHDGHSKVVAHPGRSDTRGQKPWQRPDA